MAIVPPSARSPRARRALLLVTAALLVGCPREETSAPDAGEDPAPVETPPPGDEAATPFQDIDLPPFEPLPMPPPELPPLELSPVPEAPPAALAPEKEALVAALEDLLRIPAGTAPRAEAGRKEIDVGAPPAERPASGAKERGTVERLRESVRVERRSESIGPKGPRQGTRSETDAGIRVPLDEAVSVEGGVRVDQRDEPGMSEAERKSTPRVGVEVKF